jgi:peptide subunit release factor 1 (eRF1)
MLRPLANRLLTEKSVNNSTSLVTFYIPPNTKVSDLSKRINLEVSKTPNIKSRQTRQGVQDALQAVSTHVKRMKSLPSNGVAIFAGPTIEGFTSVCVEPPRPIDSFFYRCDNKFFV